MNQAILWILSFIGLFLSLFWIAIYFSRVERIKKLEKLPSVDIIVPAYNEEKNIKKCISSILNLNYPKKLVRVIVVNDGSTDKTAAIVRSFKGKGVKLIDNKENIGKGFKAPVLNEGLNYVKAELFGCLDADSYVKKDSLIKIIHQFQDEDVGAAITAIKVKEAKTIFQKIQHFEYLFAAFIRKLMSKIETLHTTPGVLSLYRTKLIKKLGGFDNNNLTEDLEMGMRLRANNYYIKMEENAFTYTDVPSTFKSLWRQRVRWFRGFIYNSKKYKGVLFSKEHGLFGLFQFPLNLLTIIIVLSTFVLVAYELLEGSYRYLLKFLAYGTGVLQIFEIPTLKQVFTSINIKIIFPVIVVLILGIYLYHKAHHVTKEKWRYPIALVLFFTVYPIIRALHWFAAVFMELGGSKRKW